MKFLSRRKVKSLQKKIAGYVKQRENNPASDADIAKEIKVVMQLAKLYDKHRYDKKMPRAELLAIETYRAAANLGNAEAQYILSQRFFALGRFWRELIASPFSAKVHQVYADQAFKEAIGFVQAAENQNHFLAKRLHGLAFINGWGLAVDRDAGFQLVVDSIEDEGAWDKATKIFEEIGLNKPEFFSTMMALRKDQKIGR